MSHHGGDPSKHLPLAELQARLAGRRPAPRDEGTVRALVTRQPDEGRAAHEALELDPADGAVGDRWSPGKKGTDNQITAMEWEVGEIIRNGQPVTLFGDNLVLDLDLSAANLPAGSAVAIGEVRLEVTPEPHTGCSKYLARFGGDALKAISARDVREERLRGIHFRVVEGGTVSVGDTVRVLHRG